MWCPAPLGARVADKIAPPPLCPVPPVSAAGRFAVARRSGVVKRVLSCWGKEYAARRGGPKAAVGDRALSSVGIPVSPRRRCGRTEMAKGQKRSGREPKKPKQSKSKATVAASPFTAVHAKPAPTPESKK